MENTNNGLLILRMTEERVMIEDIMRLIDSGFVAEAMARLGKRRDKLEEDAIVMQGVSPELANTMARVLGRTDGYDY